MNEEETKELIIRRFTRLEGSWGQYQLNLDAHWKRLSWRWAIASARLSKRVFDILGSLALILILSPVLLLLTLLVKLDRGPAIFAQRRVGRWGRHFLMYKFRSMCPDAEERLREIWELNQHGEGVTFKVKNDPRITRVGRWMRRYSLDELPQLFNVLRGDMSLVGPRPPLPREVVLYSQADRRRLAVTPGLTCFWQIGGRSDIDFREQVQLDVRYIESQCFWLDVKLLCRTIPAVLSGRGAC